MIIIAAILLWTMGTASLMFAGRWIDDESPWPGLAFSALGCIILRISIGLFDYDTTTKLQECEKELRETSPAAATSVSEEHQQLNTSEEHTD